MTAAIVFDLDGVLADTEALKLRAHRRALEEAGGELSEALYRREMGGAHRSVIRAFLEASDLEASDEALAAYEERFQEAYRSLLTHELSPMEGAVELLDACRVQRRLLALVTSSERWMAEIVLSGLGATDLFVTMVTADDVTRTKPHPEPYLRARDALDSESIPVAVEDTCAGTESAAEAGLPVVAVRHRLNRGQAFEGTAAVVESLAPAAEFLDLVDEVARIGR